MNKENKKKAQQERAKAREKAERKKKRNDLLKMWVPIVVVIAVVAVIVAAIVMSRLENGDDDSEYGIFAEGEDDYYDDYDDYDDDDDVLWLDTDEDIVVEEGDTVNVDYAGYLDGVAFDGGTATDVDITLGSGTYIDGFEDGIIGHNVGETFDIDVTFPENYGVDSLNGQAVVFTITINGVYD